MRLFILMRGRRWDDALAICGRLREAEPDNTTGYIHGAFCLHEMGRTREARELLLGGPSELLQEPTYHYNLGCYAAVLGDLERAKKHLDDSFKMDGKFRTIAKLDPDLHAVKDFL
jgi:Flp pilus assembly protein TadD